MKQLLFFQIFFLISRQFNVKVSAMTTLKITIIIERFPFTVEHLNVPFVFHV